METESKNYIHEQNQKLREEMKKYEENLRINEERNQRVKDSISKFKKRVFKNKKVMGKAVLIGVTALTFASGLYVKNNEDELNLKRSIRTLEMEVGTHGGAKDIVSDEYIYNLNSHVQSNKCNIQNGINIENRIKNYCLENNIPKYIEVAAIEKFHYYMSNDYISANNIDLMNIYNSYNEESKYIKLTNGDIIVVDGDNATYIYADNNQNDLTK